MPGLCSPIRGLSALNVFSFWIVAWAALSRACPAVTSPLPVALGSVVFVALYHPLVLGDSATDTLASVAVHALVAVSCPPDLSSAAMAVSLAAFLAHAWAFDFAWTYGSALPGLRQRARESGASAFSAGALACSARVLLGVPP